MSSAKKYLKALTEGSNLAKNIIDQAAAFQDVLISLGNIGALKLEGKTTGELKSIIIGLAGKETLAGGSGVFGFASSPAANLQASEAALHTLGNTLSTLQGAESMHYLRPNSQGWSVITTRVHNLVKAFKENNKQFDDMTAVVRPSCPDVDCIGLEAAVGELVGKAERRKSLLNEIAQILDRAGFELLKGVETPDSYTAARAQAVSLIQMLVDDRAELTKQRDSLEQDLVKVLNQRDGAQKDRAHFEQSAVELAGKLTGAETHNARLTEENAGLRKISASLTQTNGHLTQSNASLRQHNRAAERAHNFYTDARQLLANARMLRHDADAEATLLGIDRLITRNKQLEASTVAKAERDSVEYVRTESPYNAADQNGCPCLLKHKSECLGTCSLPGKPKVEDTYFFGKLQEALAGWSKPRATFDDMLSDVGRLVEFHNDYYGRPKDPRFVKSGEASESMHSAIALRGDLIALLNRYGKEVDAHRNPQDILPAVHRALDAQANGTALTGLAACFGRDEQELAQAIGDALRGSFERLKEFGVRVDNINTVGTNDAVGYTVRIGSALQTVKVHHQADLARTNIKLVTVCDTLAGIEQIFAANGYPLIGRDRTTLEYRENLLKNINGVVSFYANIKSGKENTPVADQYNALVTVIERLPGFVYTGNVPADVRTCFDRNNKKNKEHSNRIGEFVKMLARNGVVTGGRKYDDLLRTAEVLVERGTWLRDALVKEGLVHSNATTTDCLTCLSGLMEHARYKTQVGTRPSSGWLRKVLNGLGYDFKEGTDIKQMLTALENTLNNRKSYQSLAEQRLAIIEDLRHNAKQPSHYAWLRENLNAVGYGIRPEHSAQEIFKIVGDVRDKYHAITGEVAELRGELTRQDDRAKTTLIKALQKLGLFFNMTHSIEFMLDEVDKYHARVTKTESDLRGSLLRKDQLMSNEAEPFLTRQKYREICEFLAVRGIIELKDYTHISVRKLAAFHDNFKKIEAERNTLATLSAEPRKVQFEMSTAKIKEIVDEGVAEAVGKPLELLLTLANKYGYRGPCNTFEGALAVVDQLLAEQAEELKIAGKVSKEQATKIAALRLDAALGAYLINELEHSALYKATGTDADYKITLPNLVDDACKTLRRHPAKEVAIKKLQEALEKANTERNEFRRVRDNSDNFVLRLRELLKIDGDYAGMLGAIERWLKNAPVTEQQKAELQAYANTVRTLQEAEVIAKGGNTPAPWLIADYVQYLINDLNANKRQADLFSQMRSMLINAGFGPIDGTFKEAPDMLAALFNKLETAKGQPTYVSPVNQIMFKCVEDIQQILKHWGFGPDNATSVLITERVESLAKFRAEFGKVIGTVNMPNTLNSLEVLCKSWSQGPEAGYAGPMGATCSNDMPPLPTSVNCDFGTAPHKTGFLVSDGNGKVLSSFWLDEFTRFEPLGEVAAYARTSAPVNVVRDYFDGKIESLTSVPDQVTSTRKIVRHYVRYKGIYDLVEISLAELEAICTIQNAQGKC